MTRAKRVDSCGVRLDPFDRVLDALSVAAASTRHLHEYAQAIVYWRLWSQDPERESSGQWPGHSDLWFFLFQKVMLSSFQEYDRVGSPVSVAHFSAFFSAARLQFVPNIRRRGGAFRREGGRAAAYVRSIVKAGKLPTRLNNLHDFANALTWSRFPCTKWVLYCGLQSEYARFASDQQGAVSRPEAGRGRTPCADRLTLLDEAGVIRLVGGSGCREICFGHALVEQLVRGGAAVNAPVWEVPVEEDAEDATLAVHLSAELSLPAPLSALGSCWIGEKRGC